MSKYISIDKELEAYLDTEVKKSEDGKREETYGDQLKRLIGFKKVN